MLLTLQHEADAGVTVAFRKPEDGAKKSAGAVAPASS
jgi:hypothetical protein